MLMENSEALQPPIRSGFSLRSLGVFKDIEYRPHVVTIPERTVVFDDEAVCDS